MKITIVTPSYNQGRFIERTIRSVLEQEGDFDLEYIVMDGGSTDESVRIIEDYARRVEAGEFARKNGRSVSYAWKSEKDRGQTHAINKGLAISTGDVLAYLNSDDVYFPGALSYTVSIFAAEPDVEVVYGRADHIDTDDTFIEEYPTRSFDYEVLKQICFICQPALFFRRSVYDRHGPFREALRYAMDYEYWLRIGSDAKFYYADRKLAASRFYADTKTLGDRIPVHLEFLSMFREKFGAVPDRWILGTAYVTAEERFPLRARGRQRLRYAWTLYRQNSVNFRKYDGRRAKLYYLLASFGSILTMRPYLRLLRV